MHSASFGPFEVSILPREIGRRFAYVLTYRRTLLPLEELRRRETERSALLLAWLHAPKETRGLPPRELPVPTLVRVATRPTMREITALATKWAAAHA